MKNHKHVRISIDGIKIYQKCVNCTDVELTSCHVFDYTAVAATMHCLDHASDDALYSDLAISIVKIAMKHHDIWTQLFCILSHLSFFFILHGNTTKTTTATAFSQNINKITNVIIWLQILHAYFIKHMQFY